MKKKSNVIAMVDPIDDMETLAKLTWSDDQLARQAHRRREHRREKQLKIGVDAAFVAVLVACAFIIGYCVGGW